MTDEHFRIESPVKTKREVLRTLARIYDPCGFVCPLILPMKLLFQAACERKLKWDAELPADLMQSLQATLKQLTAVADTELPRYVGIDSPMNETTYELHCFSDASKNAYSAVSYLKVRGQGESLVSFIMAKSHVSRTEDKEELRIPRLELLGFLIGSRLLNYVESRLELPIQKKYLWTDSLVVLGWMRSNKLLPPFVTNRVNEIKKKHQHTEMFYIHTKSNPADVATKPELWEEKRALWYSGPDFLGKDESAWPENRHYDTHLTFLSLQEDSTEEVLQDQNSGEPGEPPVPPKSPEACVQGEEGTSPVITRERYWIPQGKAQVVKILRRCAQCVRHGGGPYKLPSTPALPPEQVNYSEPFTYTGVDYLGPLYVDTNQGKAKRWVALFTCLAVRAVHLEVVNDLTAEECLLALRRFVATRGVPSCI